MVPYAFWSHGLCSPGKACGRKACGLVEVRPVTRQRVVTEVLFTADDVRIHPFDTRWYQRPRYQDAGVPGCAMRYTRLKGHVWRPGFVGFYTYPWPRKGQHEEMSTRSQLDFKIVFRPDDETLDDIILPQIGHPRAGWCSGDVWDVLVR